MRVSQGLIAAGLALVAAGCGTTTGIPAMTQSASGPPARAYQTMSTMPSNPGAARSGHRNGSYANPGGPSGNPSKELSRNPGQTPQGPQGQQPQPPSQAPFANPRNVIPGVAPTKTSVSPPSKGPGAMPEGQSRQVTRPEQAPGATPEGQSHQVTRPEQAPGATHPGTGVTQRGGGGGPINIGQPVVQKAMSSLNLHEINQTQATNQLTTINQGQLSLTPARSFSEGMVSGIAPEALSVLRANLTRARFLRRHGLFIPYVQQGTQYVPLIVTVSRRPAVVFFTEDCATGRYIAHTMIV